jgi:uncharacterized protein YegP (UPF0339 family)
MSPSNSRRVFGWALFLGVSFVAGLRTNDAIATSSLESQAKSKPKADAEAKTLTFEVYQDKVEEYRWRLKATNKEIIATSGQGYKDKRDCKKAIERIKDDAATKLEFETYKDAAEDTRWRLKSTNGQIIASSGQGYKDKRDCEHAIDVIKKGAAKAKVEDEK